MAQRRAGAPGGRLPSADQSNAATASRWRGRWQSAAGYVAALTIFLASRAAVVMAIRFGADFMSRNPERAHSLDLGTEWYYRLLRWDSGWYLRIMRDGYNYTGDDTVQQTVNFSPLYPLTAKLVSLVGGLSAPVAALIVASVAALVAVLLFYRLVRDDYGHDVALIAVAFMSFFPTSLFLSAGYAESLTLLLMVACLLMIKQERLLWAAAAAGLALAARPTGIVLLPALWWVVWQKYRGDPARLLGYAAAVTALATAGLWVFSLYQWAAFGFPFGSLTNRTAWLGAPTGTGLLDALLLKPFQILRLSAEPGQAAPLFFIVCFVVIVAAWRKLSVPLILVGLGALLLPYLAYGGGPQRFYGMPRFALLAFPAFIAAALFCQGRPWLTLSLIGLSASLLFMYTALFGQWYWVA